MIRLASPALVAALCVFPVPSAVAQPQEGPCAFRARAFVVGDPRSRSAIGIATASGVRCTVRWTVGGGAVVDRTIVTTPPKSGRVTVAGTSTITYQSATGFRGRDRFSGRICGMSNVGRGCTPFVAVVIVR